ncbi:DNA methylAse containing a Zn-ribbon [Candidatus Magnetoovum chiemensis]|nr:DNA methylAse containing a Zn-ribbon [Candidatus Magnetoovum chiemensis]
MSDKSFIEVQFPVSKISKESYKERKANYSQTLTGLGKWWGRKPLILVRAAIIGLLMPVGSDPKKDREVFLKILTMDNDGLWQRKSKSIPLKEIYNQLTPQERHKWFDDTLGNDKLKYKAGIKAEAKNELQEIVFNRLSYDDKLEYCYRPEQIEGPAQSKWNDINSHLGTNAHSLSELVQELGKRRFGHIPRIGDAFCGGGSIPFEAARIGCEAYGSDLNPVAALLTWSALNIVGGGKEVAEQVKQAQMEVYNAVDKQVTEWGIEHNEKGWRADAYLYCNEVKCPECGWRVPLAPSWVIGEKTKCVAKLIPDKDNKRFDIAIVSGVTDTEMEKAKNDGTVDDSKLRCPNPECLQKTPISVIRRDKLNGYGLRMWENDDLVPRHDDVFQERLYCIRWVETYYDDKGKERTKRLYMAPDENDIKREEKVLELLKERFHEWQDKGFIPSRRIETGYNTDQPIRERGWTRWHHLFNPRQLLLNGLFNEDTHSEQYNKFIYVALIMGLAKLANYNAKLSRWLSNQANEKGSDVFSNQAFNTMYNYPSRTMLSFITSWFYDINPYCIYNNKIEPIDARNNNNLCNLWLTDPPYANAVNYHELSEFFLAWYETHLTKIFPDWYADSKRALAITGSDENFRKSMVECYKNLTNHMPDDGMQIVMFTHQDAGVWADLALILWASGLRVTAAWCIATETESELKKGNYVQGTVLLVLRKQTSEDTAFIDEIYAEVESEVEAQLKSMLELEDDEDPNFGDADYQLAAYAASLRVLTKYKNIEEIKISYELNKPRKKGEVSPIEEIIRNAVKVACDYLVPKGFDTFVWKNLTTDERFYLKGLEIESHGEYRSGVYQELARGFGIREYKPMIESGKANQTRLKTATEFAAKELRDNGFGATLLRNALFAIREVVRTDEVQTGKNWLRNEVKDYWNQRSTLIEILNYLSTMGFKIDHWEKDAEAAKLLSGAVQHDHV